MSSCCVLAWWHHCCFLSLVLFHLEVNTHRHRWCLASLRASYSFSVFLFLCMCWWSCWEEFDCKFHQQLSHLSCHCGSCVAAQLALPLRDHSEDNKFHSLNQIDRYCSLLIGIGLRDGLRNHFYFCSECYNDGLEKKVQNLCIYHKSSAMFQWFLICYD